MRNIEPIPVVFTPDENYMVPTCIAILSMLRTKKCETKYHFIFVLSDKFACDYMKYIDRISQMEKEFVYEIKFISPELFENTKPQIEHITQSAYYRLIVANILKEYDKCMYHDGDILVNKDLSDMYNVDLQTCYIAGIKAPQTHQITKRNIKKVKEWGLPSCDQYIYSGDLVLNLKYIREHGLVNKFICEMNTTIMDGDQDILNKCCYNHIYFLPLKYCMPTCYLNNNRIEEMTIQVFGADEIAEAKSDPAILHFAGAIAKPWINSRAAYSDKWWEYAKEFLDDVEYQMWRVSAERFQYCLSKEYLYSQLYSEKEYIIFGCGEQADVLYRQLTIDGYQVKCFIDNSVELQGKYRGEGTTLVLDVKTAVSMYENAVYIITSQIRRREMREQLNKLGVNDARIMDYYYKDSRYYNLLDPKYYKDEGIEKLNTQMLCNK